MTRFVPLFCVIAIGPCGVQRALANPLPNTSLAADDANAADQAAGPHGGHVAGNFAISAQIAENGGPQAWIMVNPPQLGIWLQHFAVGELWLKEDGRSKANLHLKALKVSRTFPEYDATYETEGHLRLNVTIFAPLSIDSKIGFLPALITRIKLKADRPWRGVVGYTLTQSRTQPDNQDDDPTPWPTATRSVRTGNLRALIRGPAFLALTDAHLLDAGATSDSTGGALTISGRVEASPGIAISVAVIAGKFDANGYYANDFPFAEKLIGSLAARADTLYQQLRAFEAALPRTGDTKIDEYLRWYLTAGVLLTKGDRAGYVLTMGYRELNQRDSFWTSGLHLVFWPDLERKMIAETIHGQDATGQIPTTLLPTIDRDDQIDSVEYFILRVARDYRWYRDDEFLNEAWPAIQKGINYLNSRDVERVGVPMQGSYWADWMEDPGQEGRKYAPHFALLWMAAARAASELALDVNDAAAARQYGEMADRAEAFINRPFDDGGLWNGTDYVERWADGRERNRILHDQVIGAYYHLISDDKLRSIYQSFKPRELAWGIPSIMPNDPSGHDPQGPQDPWGMVFLQFVDATGRYQNGRVEEAEAIIRNTGSADLDADGNDQPSEYLQGKAGSKGGFAIQGWDANMFTAIYFGALGIERTSRSGISIHVHIPKRDFSTAILLPTCSGTLSRQDGKLSWVEDHDACGSQGMLISLDQDR